MLLYEYIPTVLIIFSITCKKAKLNSQCHLNLKLPAVIQARDVGKRFNDVFVFEGEPANFDCTICDRNHGIIKVIIDCDYEGLAINALDNDGKQVRISYDKHYLNFIKYKFMPQPKYISVFTQ